MTDARWLTDRLGGRWYGANGLAFCPAHENNNTPALSLGNGDGGRLLLKCHAGCTFGDVIAALRERGLLCARSNDLPPASTWIRPGAGPPARDREQDARKARRASAIWQRGAPITGSLGEAYLRRRGIIGPFPTTLRYVSRLAHPNGPRLPAIVARIDGTASFAIHRTYLGDGPKGQGTHPPSKAMLGAARGGAVRLCDASLGDSVDNNPGAPLVICEGIETGLSLLEAPLEPALDRPVSVWAALSTSGLKTVTLPRRPGHLVIAPDGDAAGREAATVLSYRAVDLGWRVSHLTPPEGCDWNDKLMRLRGLA